MQRKIKGIFKKLSFKEETRKQKNKSQRKEE